MQPQIYVKKYPWCEGIVTAYCKSFSFCVRILTKKQRNSESIDNLSKTLFKADAKIYFQISKSLKNFKMKKFLLKSCPFASHPSDFLQFQKQLMTKSEKGLGFKHRKSLIYKKEALTQINRNLRKKKELYLLLYVQRVVSPSLCTEYIRLGLFLNHDISGTSHLI